VIWTRLTSQPLPTGDHLTPPRIVIDLFYHCQHYCQCRCAQVRPVSARLEDEMRSGQAGHAVNHKEPRKGSWQRRSGILISTSAVADIDVVGRADGDDSLSECLGIVSMSWTLGVESSTMLYSVL
jgi:hypothetical protein